MSVLSFAEKTPYRFYKEEEKTALHMLWSVISKGTSQKIHGEKPVD